LVVGAPNSSNSLRLVEVAERQSCAKSFLVQRAADIPWDKLGLLTSLGITAGASAPEQLVNEVVDAFRAKYAVTVEIVTTAEENIAFNVPRELRDVAATPR
jgi:4-hydroxy-3-methylbut-2-en-1-yl diphosphate reductase